MKRGATTELYLRCVWRGWMLVAELNASSDKAKVKTYTWGPDISGTFGGAGGYGGVLVMKDHTSGVNETFFPAYDAQGNVYGLIDTSGNLDAAYEYDPWGKLIRASGARKDSMSLLYSTKYYDKETGLLYYGYRYYDPRQGRFINQDPLGVDGGANLYGFVGNNPVNAIDVLGLNPNHEIHDHPDFPVHDYTEQRAETRSTLLAHELIDERQDRERTAGGGLNQVDASGGGSGRKGSEGDGDNPGGKEEEERKKRCSELDERFGKFVRGTHDAKFDSHDEAAIAALFKALPLTLFSQHEWGGYTQSRDGGFYFTNPAMGERSSWPISRDPAIVSGLANGSLRVYHTHPMMSIVDWSDPTYWGS